MNVTCYTCDHVGEFQTFPPNLTSGHNAIRCPACGSTRNVYNRVHSHLMSQVIARKRAGPVTHRDVLKELATWKGCGR